VTVQGEEVCGLGVYQCLNTSCRTAVGCDPQTGCIYEFHDCVPPDNCTDAVCTDTGDCIFSPTCGECQVCDPVTGACTTADTDPATGQPLVCGEFPDLAVCCPSGACCPSVFACCGDTCCAFGSCLLDARSGEPTCCEGRATCGEAPNRVCCGESEYCSHGECCPEGVLCCHGTTCEPGQECGNAGCCAVGEGVCGGVCYDHQEQCCMELDGQEVVLDLCDGQCCSGVAACCRGSCCGPGETCCLGLERECCGSDRPYCCHGAFGTANCCARPCQPDVGGGSRCPSF
jgi:hypothetical protein